MAEKQVPIAIIGGSGFYEMPGVEIVDEFSMETPFGPPSDRVVIAEIQQRRVAFLPRHGRGHRYNPTHIPVRANIWALRSLGVRWIVSVSAVGSLKLKILPRDFVIPDQIIDRTKSRANTLYPELAVHCAFADPFCGVLRRVLIETSRDLGIRTHDGGTYVCMEGPLFSTRAESELYRSWGASIVGMTALPEAKMAREAEISYATVALSTDYDCWHDEDVTVEMVLENLRLNRENAQRLVKEVVGRIPLGETTAAHQALEGALLTAPDQIDPELRHRYEPLLGRFFGEQAVEP